MQVAILLGIFYFSCYHKSHSLVIINNHRNIFITYTCPYTFSKGVWVAPLRKGSTRSPSKPLLTSCYIPNLKKQISIFWGIDFYVFFNLTHIIFLHWKQSIMYNVRMYIVYNPFDRYTEFRLYRK